MRFARFQRRQETLIGILEGETIRALKGSLFDGYEETNEVFDLSEIELLPPVIPTKIVCTDLDPNALTQRTYLNGDLVQDDNTSNFIFSVQHLVHYVSERMTLYPGDIITCGTPRGVAPMKPGDVVEVEIEGIGTLKNPVG